MSNPDRLSKHHTLWERREYQRHSVQKRLREHPGMIIPIPRRDHDQLHMEVEALPVISDNLARVALTHLAGMDWQIASDRPRLDMFDSLTEHFYSQSYRLGRIGREAGMFAEQFEDQRRHLERAYIL